MRQLYKVWAKSRSDLDTEVDRLLPMVRQQKGNPNYGRIGLWNTVAAEWYAATSEEEKENTTQQAKAILNEETEKWKNDLADPTSIEEALE